MGFANETNFLKIRRYINDLKCNNIQPNCKICMVKILIIMVK